MAIDVDEAGFEQAVIERSRSVPVLVDFWAEWCGPCHMLAPVIERAVAATDGDVELVKIDIDANPGIARRYGIQGIPNVKAFRDGELVDEFTGAQPPAVVERFVEGLRPKPSDALLAAGDEQSLREAIELDPTRADVRVQLARILVAVAEASGDTRDRIRRTMIGTFAELGDTDPLAAAIRKRLAASLY